MLEDIKNFQEKLMAKYGVEANIDIDFHLGKEVDIAREILKDFNLTNSRVTEHKRDNGSRFKAISCEFEEKTTIRVFHDSDLDIYEKIDAFWKKHENGIVSESKQEDLVQAFVEAYWERFGEDADFDTVCDATQVHQDIVRKIYDRWIKESIIA
jgi:hypothetical protein